MLTQNNCKSIETNRIFSDWSDGLSVVHLASVQALLIGCRA